MTETRSTALPACSDGFDDSDGGPERSVYIQMRGVEQVRIRSRFERSSRTGPVALVPAQNVGKHIGHRCRFSCLLELRGAALRPCFGGCGDEDFYIGIREDDRADVAAVEHGTGSPEIPLPGEKRR